jgi:hypothetical protein
VESVKLFDVSSFVAELDRPRAKFPLVPPFIELPFIGSIASIPLPRARVYHRSTAIVSAIIVPTAADLAYGLVFTPDRGALKTRGNTRNSGNPPYRFYSYSDLSQMRRAPIYAYHKEMVNCLAKHQTDASACRKITFSTVPPAF